MADARPLPLALFGIPIMPNRNTSRTPTMRAVERLCDRALLLRGGAVEFDGPTHEAVVRYRRLLAGERDPAERGAGLKEWGSGEARIDSVELLGPDGGSRNQFLAGEPLAW